VRFGALIAIPGDPAALCSEPRDLASKETAMARSKDMQQALDIVAGRKPEEPPKWGGLERIGLLLWTGVGIMIIGLAALFVLN
jgi:hypothetical protein